MQIGTDKLLHAAVSACLTLASALALLHVSRYYINFAACLALVVGISKEAWDACHDGHAAELADFMADCVGTLAGVLWLILTK